jgi:hypothetical protein
VRSRHYQPTGRQIAAARAVVAWYLELYHGTTDDPGVLAMFEDAGRVGAFAVRARDLRDDEDEALFRLLIATTMFQRRQDQQILRILRSLSTTRVGDLTNPTSF